MRHFLIPLFVAAFLFATAGIFTMNDTLSCKLGCEALLCILSAFGAGNL